MPLFGLILLQVAGRNAERPETNKVINEGFRNFCANHENVNIATGFRHFVPFGRDLNAITFEKLYRKFSPYFVWI